MQYRSSWMTDELDVLSRPVPQVLRQGSGAARREMARRRKWSIARPGGRWARWARLLPSVPEDYGGLGASFAYDAAILEDIETRGAGGHDRHLRAQRHRRALHPELRLRGAEAALAAEDGQRRVRRRHCHDRARHRLRPAGHADHGRKQGNNYVINGQKTFITNGQAADLIIVVARTGGPGAKGISLIVVETDGQRGIPARPQPRQDRPARLRHVRIVLRRCAWRRRKTCWAPRKATASSS